VASLRTNIARRKLLGTIGVGAAIGLTPLGRTEQLSLPKLPANTSPSALARDEAFWSEVATNYDRTVGIVNLEHGYWGKMAHPVQNAYIDATRMVNAQNSFYARKKFETDEMESVRRVARALGVHDEIVLTRNATESIHNLIRQYRGLADGHGFLQAGAGFRYFHSRPQRACKRLLRSRYATGFHDTG
jgi:hypothetical protein